VGFLFADVLQQLIELFGSAVPSALYPLDMLSDVFVSELTAV
jgi:hypothetical protein